jgi:hypothetical protein
MSRVIKAHAVFATIVLVATTPSLAQMQTYCSNISGNIACTTYDHGASTQSYCTQISTSLSCTTYSDNDRQIRIQQNYEAGQVLGTALGEAVIGAIEEYRAHKRARLAKQDEWNQFVQDTISKTELACEADPKHDPPVAVCRSGIFALNLFIHMHQKDFIVDGNNMKILNDALGKTAPSDDASWTEQTFETAFQSIDKKLLDKKAYLSYGHDDKQIW